MNPQPQPVTPATAEEVQALRDALAKATQGEWFALTVEPTQLSGSHSACGTGYGLLQGPKMVQVHKADAFTPQDATAIALAHNIAPKLLARLDAAEAEIARLRAGGCARDQRTTQHCADAVAAENKAVEFAWMLMGMSDQPPLRKPRHADGRLMTEDEIRGLDGRELDLQVHHCLIDSDPVWLLPQNRSCVSKYSSDIAAAFEVDRPEWRWEMEEFTDAIYSAVHQLGDVYEFVELTLDHKPTASDHARARCIAALLLAAKIGE